MSKKLLAAALLPFAALAQDPSATTNEEVTVVTASRVEQAISDVLAPITVITRDDIELSMAKSVPDILRMLPGIDIGQNGGRGSTTSVFMRGSESDHVLVLIDGVRLPSSITSGVDFSKIPVSQIETIEVVRGPRGAIYGSDAIGGVINIITRGQQGESIKQITAGIGSDKYYEADLFLSSDLTDKLHVNFGLGYDDSEGYNSKPILGVNDGDKHGAENKNVLVGADYQLSTQLNAFINSRYSQSVSEYDGSNAASQWSPEVHLKKEQWLETTSIMTGAKYSRDNYFGSLTYSFGENKSYQYKAGDDYKDATSTLFTKQHNVSFINSFILSNELLLNAGLDWRDDQVKDDSDSIYSNIDGTISRTNTGVFTTAVYEMSSITLDGSVRYDDNETFGGHTTWALASGWEFVKNYSVLASTGSSFKAPSMYDLYSNPSSSYGAKGNPNLKPEIGESIEVGIKGITGPLDWKVIAYKNKVQDLIGSQSINGITTAYNIDGESVIQGVEFEGNAITGIVSHQAVLEYLDPKAANGDTLLRRAKYKAKWKGVVQLGDVDLSLRYLYQGERDDYVGNNVETVAGYSLWDISAAYLVTEAFKVSARIDNVFDKEYATAQGYPAPERGYYINATYEF
ncbi:TonB-dependent receptor domain-containing protein [Moritella sp. Urea-trap-13]|uniref:TonB-dependent receptor domain-containing protein n=1 Tax=Moritella sp. Urea-trap-13 TaxID=2058327 RepID=UPI000C333FEE|nr:TonB-dependent receptor [Moritella sp. Urea-trap-13]PKH09118.1 TonB-dependent receptor [Moritella sp. Urea-trap-13]